MDTIKATWKNGQIIPDGPVDWPEGSRLRVEPEPLAEVTGMTEDEQGEDVDSISRWLTDFMSIPPLPMSPEDEAAMTAWQQKIKAFNIDAVRRQMEEGIR